MAKKRSATIPYVIGPVIGWTPANFDWKKVERAYGKTFTPSQRQRIVEATQTYVAFRSREIDAEPVRVSVARIKRLRRSAESFRKAVEANGSSAELFARQEIKLQFSDDNLVAPDLFDGLNRVVVAFIRACERAIANLQLRPGEAEPVRATDGTAWRMWIIEQTTLAGEWKLPVGVRSDTDKNKGKPSAFVRLISEFQRQLPKELGHERLSDPALAKAINRARPDRDISR
jgi:hypothetical protein